jgi:hypothetical protein
MGRLNRYAIIPQFHLLDRQAPLEILFPDGITGNGQFPLMLTDCN